MTTAIQKQQRMRWVRIYESNPLFQAAGVGLKEFLSDPDKFIKELIWNWEMRHENDH